MCAFIKSIFLNYDILSLNGEKNTLSINLWQKYNIRLESWGTDYDTPISLNQEDSLLDDAIDLNVECDEWVGRRPSCEPALPNRILFVDGRRRLDTRFIGQNGNEILYGAFATIAVGAVLVDRATRRSAVSELIVKRAIAIGGISHSETIPPTRVPCPLGSGAEIIYSTYITDAESEPQKPIALVQKAMREEEAKLAVKLAIDPDVLVVRDGPLLHKPYKAPESTLGYVKTMGKAYLTGDSAKLLWELQLGERTPIFSIGKQKSPKRHWSWYLRSGQQQIDHKQLGYHDLHGIVRLDLYGEVPLNKATEIADQSTYLIPQYASHPSRDPRAPQNLTPVGGLEKELGRHMGDKGVIERRLRTFLASEGVMK